MPLMLSLPLCRTISVLILCIGQASAWGKRAEPAEQINKFKTFIEKKRDPARGHISGLLNELTFTDYSNDVLRASIVHHLSPEWTPLDRRIEASEEFNNLTSFFRKLPDVDGTISCIWDPSLNKGAKLLHNKRIFIAANFKDNEEVLPHILVQLWHTIALLDQGSVYVSIYESSSKDSTGVWLGKYAELFTALGVPHRINKDGAISHPGNDIYARIEMLSRVRNAALEPLWDGEWLWHSDDISSGSFNYSRNHSTKSHQRRLAQLPPTHIMFTNDVFMCARDSIRLIYHESDLACGTDWLLNDGLLTFYDLWVARDMQGYRLFWRSPYLHEPLSQKRIEQGLHVPVKSCWNGLAIMKASPFLREGLRFRKSRPGECLASECKLICDDMRELGFSNIVMDPNVRLAYNLKDAIDVFNPDMLRKIAITDWADIRASPIDILQYGDSDASDCCEISGDKNGINWDKCEHRLDKKKF